VIVTANIPPFARNGSKLDIIVSSMGNAKSLPAGVDPNPAARCRPAHLRVGQGPPRASAAFRRSGGSGSSVQENVTTVGRIPNGAIIEHEIKTTFSVEGKITLALRAPNFDTATRIAEGLTRPWRRHRAHAGRRLDRGQAPSELKNKPVEMVSKLGDIDVEPGSLARVV